MSIPPIIIVAYDQNRAIGKEGKIPWHLKGDFAHFKSTTKGEVVVMGRKTWDSLPKKPLPDRVNIVITRNKELLDSPINTKIWFEHSFEWYLDKFKNDTATHFIIGGEEIYRQALPHVRMVIASEIKTKIDGADAFFPELDQEFKEMSRVSMPPENGLEWDIVIYQRNTTI